MRIKLFLLLFVILPLSISKAQLSSFDYNGYAKYLFSSVKYPQTSSNYLDHLIHSRLNTRWYPDNNITAALELRMRAFYGQSVENLPNFLEQIKSKHDFVNLDWVAWDENKTIGYLEVDRLWLDWYLDNLELTVGRQRIAWGLSWVWNPMDIFNPLSILDFDYEERPGVDAIRVQYYTGAVTKIEAAVKPSKYNDKWTAAGLWSINAWDYDFNLIAGSKNNRWVFGGGWVGDIYGAGFRGEVTVTEAPPQTGDYDFIYSFFGVTSLSSQNEPVVTFVFSGDYTFKNSFYIHTEILHNNNGKTKLTGLFSAEAAQLGMLTAARWSLYQEFAYDVTPLLRSSFFAILNPDDKSYVLVPSVSYSVVTNLDFLLIGLLFHGESLTEYGNFGSSVFIRFKYSF